MQDAVDEIVAHWRKYVKSKAELRKHLPRQLKKFFIAYGLQASKVCKRNLIEQLKKASNERNISEKDFDLVSERIRVPISKLVGPDRRIEDLLIVVEQDRRDTNRKLPQVFMYPLRQGIFRRIIERCSKKFEPIYSTLIAPIVRLATIDLNYDGKSMRAQIKSFESERIFQNWFDAVIACEINFGISMVKIPKQVQTPEGIKGITILDEDDMRALESKGLARVEPEIEWHPFVVRDIAVDDLVLDNGDENLNHSMRRYKGYLNETDRFYLRSMKQAVKEAKSTIDSVLTQWSSKLVKKEFE